MSHWNAKYTNDCGEYEITFASKSYEKAKAVEKVCQAVLDDVIKSPEDLTPFLRDWINVEDALPADNEKVLVCTRSKKMCVARWSARQERFVTSGNVTVTHWQPLPDFPKEEV